MKQCARNASLDLHIQDVLLIGHLVKQPVSVIQLQGMHQHARGEAVAMSGKNPEEVVAALRGDNNQDAIKAFLDSLRGRHPTLIDELDPEVDVLIEGARIRAQLAT